MGGERGGGGEVGAVIHNLVPLVPIFVHVCSVITVKHLFPFTHQQRVVEQHTQKIHTHTHRHLLTFENPPRPSL